jgi:acetylornithine deacetylase/succinyl-diaminopimelate desuccinylase-like protein
MESRSDGVTEQARRRERIRAAAALALLAAAVAGLLIYNRIEAARIGTGLYIPRREKITPEVLLLQQYVRIDTTNPPGNEIAAARWLGARLTRFGIPFEIIESAPTRANLYARLRGKQPGEGLLLINHMDVVPANPRDWTKPPFRAEISANMMWGRGTFDMKGIGIAQLEGFIAAATKGRPPEHDIVFLATADEETGSAFGMRWLLDHRPDVVSGIKYVLSEGGVTEMERTTLTYYGIEIGSKQGVTVDMVAPTKEQLQAARIHLERFFIRDHPDRVLPEVERFFRQIAPLRIEQRDLLADVGRAIAIGKFWLLSQAYRSLTQDVVWVGNIRQEGGHFAAAVHMSNLPDTVPDERIAWLQREIAPFGAKTGSVTRKEGPVPLSSDQTPFFGILEKEIHREYGPVRVGTEILATSVNESRFLRPRGMICYGFLPFPVDFYQSKAMHNVDERVTIDWFTQGVGVMRRVVLAYAGLL